MQRHLRIRFGKIFIELNLAKMNKLPSSWNLLAQHTHKHGHFHLRFLWFQKGEKMKWYLFFSRLKILTIGTISKHCHKLAESRIRSLQMQIIYDLVIFCAFFARPSIKLCKISRRTLHGNSERLVKNAMWDKFMVSCISVSSFELLRFFLLHCQKRWRLPRWKVGSRSVAQITNNRRIRRKIWGWN